MSLLRRKIINIKNLSDELNNKSDRPLDGISLGS